MKVVILAGGSGTRLWPVSRKNIPKQVQPFGDRDSLLQKTYRRLRRSWNNADIFVATNEAQAPAIRKQLPTLGKGHYIIEPLRCDTSAAIGLIATYLWKRNPKDIMVTVSSDHYFKEEVAYNRAIRAAGRIVAKHPDRTLLFGVKPRYPHTGLGYIMMESQVDRFGPYEVFSVKRFVEKPDLATARKFVSRWEYLWNIGSFAFRVDAMLEKYRRWLPKSYALLMRIAKTIGTRSESATLKRLFPKMDRIAIDYGINEHDRSMLVMPLDLTWADIGSWREVFEMRAPHQHANVTHGKHVHIDSRGNIVYSYTGKLIATAGLTDMVVIDTEDALLICPKDRAQDVKKIVTELERQQLHHLL
ncbi:MAG: sugar phosphate nucleotidyltransferase [Candidatus Kerfeldbacteria bacterium]